MFFIVTKSPDFLVWSPINFPAVSPGLSPVQISEQDEPLDKYLHLSQVFTFLTFSAVFGTDAV